MTLSDYGSWASLIGLVITGATCLTIFHIKKKFLLQATIEGHSNNIKDISAKISTLLQNFNDNKSEIDEQFDIAKVELRAMKKFASGDFLSDIKKSHSKISKFRSSFYFWHKKDESEARAAKGTLSVVAAQIQHEKTQISYR